MKVDLLKKLIKEAVREVLIEELQLSTKQKPDTSIKENHTASSNAGNISANPLQDALASTMKEFTRKDYSNFIINENSFTPEVQTPQIGVGLDLSNLDFVKKASSVYNLSKEKDKLR